MKASRLIAAATVFFIAAAPMSAQGFLKNLAEKAKSEVNKAVNNAVGTTDNNGSNASSNAVKSVTSAIPAAKGKTYYVSASTGSARADGLTPSTAMRDLQKAIDTAEDNDQIFVAEGNYLGNLDRGYIQVGKFGDATHDFGKFIIHETIIARRG